MARLRRGAMLRTATWCASALAAAALTTPPTALAEPPAVTSATPSPTIQTLRRHILDADVNTLTFHNMDQIFDTRVVPRSGPVWRLARADAPLDFSVTYRGKTSSAEHFLQDNATNAVLIIKGGRIVYERYFNNTDAGAHFASFSMAKSITSELIGLALHDGYIRSLDDPLTAYVPELKGSGYDGVTIRQALQMRSGVDYQERYDFGAKSAAQSVFENAVVENKARFADLAPTLKRAQPPGRSFNYSTMDTAVLGWVLERAIRRPLEGYMSERLWQPLGMESYGFFIADGAPGVGRSLNGMGFNATLRDYARLGLMMLQGGRGGPEGAQIVPADWVRQATASADIGPPPFPVEVPLGYGYQWWALAGTRAYSAIGLQGQFIYVDPASDTVVVKLSHFPPGDPAMEDAALAFMKAASAWTPHPGG